MPIYKTKKENFFKKWTSEMAYILGFFTADGCMVKNKRGARFIEFQITDKKLLEKIRETLSSNHKISERQHKNKNWRNAYHLQIGSKTMFDDLLKLGLTPNKSKTIKLPHIPNKYFSHFLKGYFDGDGCVNICIYKRKNRNNKSTTIINSGFTSGSKKILLDIKNRLTKSHIIEGGTLYYHQGYRLWFSIKDSMRLYKFMYKNSKNNLFLHRKKRVFEKYFKMGR